MNENKDYVVKKEDVGNIYISEEVIALVAGGVMYEVDGVRAPQESKYRSERARQMTKAVKVKLEEDGVTLDCSIVVNYGKVVTEVAANVQKAVNEMVSSVTGLAVKAVNVNVIGVSFAK